MNRWVSFRLKVLSLITNNDNSWQHSQIATEFDDMNKEFFFYGLCMNETLFRKLF